MKWGIALTSAILAATTTSALDVSDCSCGFLDAANDQIWTDALIVYFNETNQLPQEFKALDFHHRREFGYNSLYRQGATPDNVMIGNATDENVNEQVLQLWIDQGTGQHYVQGAGIEALRQDIHFGTFRASMRGPNKNTGGSAMSMELYHNRTSFIEVDMCNMQYPEDAKFLALKDGEFPDTKYQLNYTYFANDKNATVGGDPWEFVESKIDWTAKHVNWTFGGNQTRSAKRSRTDLYEPLPLVFKHWSIGDKYWMAGPPNQRNQADLAWVRAFFNSSLTTKDQQTAFDGRCRGVQMCSVDDITLRGSSPYEQAALVPFKEPPMSKSWRVPAGATSGAVFAFGCLTLINVLFRRAPWKLLLARNRGKKVHVEPELSSPSPFVQQLLGVSKDEKTLIPAPPEKKPSVVGFVDVATPVEDKRDSMRRRSVKFFNPFDAGSGDDFVKRHSEAFTSAAEVPRTMSNAQPTDWRRKSMAYHGQLPEMLPERSEQAKKVRKASVAFAEDTTFRNRQASTFQSIKGRSGSTVKALGHVLQHGMHDAERVEPIELQQHLVHSESDSDNGKPNAARRESHANFAGVVMRDPDTLQDVDLSHQSPDARRSTIIRGRQPSVLERYRENHFASIGGVSMASGVSRGSIPMRDWNTQELHEVSTIDPPHESQMKMNRRITLAEAVPVSAVDMPLPKAKEHEARINYLAGLVAFSSLGVTVIHFMLSFNPYAGGLNYGQHYRSEYWARWTVTPAILNPIWLGPFFVTSCRFLAARYLRDGDLGMIAEKTLLRAPRLLLPCFIVAALEYLCFELDFMQWLQYLPSISWSEWAFMSNYDNFGHYLNAMLELAYLIPNAAPQVVSHYCVGVLWSIPVQLQFSFMTLLGVVMIRDIKTHWKRFAFYSWCIIAHWYSLSWGSCFWAGLMLADLQVTYKFSAKVQARPVVSVLFCMVMWVLAIASAAMTLLEDRLDITTMSSERNIHPDMYTGKKLGDTVRGGYPLYFEPRLNTLVFAVSMQFLVETSTWFQAFLSMKVWQPIFPHAFTIYLIHGFIWWTLGSYMVVMIGSSGAPYWGVLLATAVVCYFTLAITVVALSFLTETITAACCRNIARWAMEPKVPKQPTLEPFPRNLFLDRNSDTAALKDEETAVGETGVGAGNMVRRPTLLPGSISDPTARRPTIVDGAILNDAEKAALGATTMSSPKPAQGFEQNNRHSRNFENNRHSQHIADFVIEEEDEEEMDPDDPRYNKSSVASSSTDRNSSSAGASSSSASTSRQAP
ncbi:hypothetical protein E4T49_07942 [Aureobasidium sp. EXF-10728]|nr:hypothetical protein E4T49_07942 [Aureobasidium sp. EXF-10728]